MDSTALEHCKSRFEKRVCLMECVEETSIWLYISIWSCMASN